MVAPWSMEAVQQAIGGELSTDPFLREEQPRHPGAADRLAIVLADREDGQAVRHEAGMDPSRTHLHRAVVTVLLRMSGLGWRPIAAVVEPIPGDAAADGEQKRRGPR